jgi:glycosyltransferase involved in cell wall biosynthesis
VVTSEIFLYANHPVILVHGSYYAKTKNFIDFLAKLTEADARCHLAVPCKKADNLPEPAVYVEIPLPRDRLIELPYYQQHWAAPLVSFLAAVKFVRLLKARMRSGNKVMVGGPGPNSFLFWCSFLLPAEIPLAFFIRGDSVKTVREIYKGKLAYPLAVSLVTLFRQRIRSLLKKRRAKVFVYGQALLDHYPAHPDDRYVIAPLLDRNWLPDGPLSRPGNSGTLRALFVGRLSPEKNVLNLVEACALALSEGSPFQLTILGEGILHGRLRELIELYGLEAWVELKGHVPNGEPLQHEYDSHDLLCIPSLTEATPRVVVEAFARGCPVLASRVGSIDDMFPDAVCFLNNTDARSIVDGIRWCTSNREELKTMGRKGMEMVDRFLLEQNARYVLDILNKDVPQPPGSGQ